VVTVKDPALNTWTYSFDPLGNRTGVTDPDLGTWSYSFDKASRLVTQTDAKGQVTSLSYDVLSRVLGKTVTGPGLATETTSNAYDEARAGFFNLGKLTTATRNVPLNGAIPAVAISRLYDHDMAGRISRETSPAINGLTRTVNLEYWPDGSLKRRQGADGIWAGPYTYDVAGRLTAIDNPQATSATEPDLYISSMAYNARGQATSVTYGNGVVASYVYDAGRGWLTSSKVLQGANLLLEQSYTRNPRGMITSITSPDPARSWLYGYDGLDRLILADNGNGTVEDRSFAYDAVDNVIFNSALCAANPNLIYPAAGQPRPHAPTSICGSPVSYDANGNTLSYDVDGAGPLAARTLVYDGGEPPAFHHPLRRRHPLCLRP
jgi:YD repeat-containing protein